MGHERQHRAGAIAARPDDGPRTAAGTPEPAPLSLGLWGAGNPPDSDPGAIAVPRPAISSFEPLSVQRPLSTVRREILGARPRPSPTPFRGRFVDAEVAAEMPRDLAWDATLRAAAPLQTRRSRPLGVAIALEREDLRQKRRRVPPGRLTLFVVDASGSMGTELTALARKVALRLLREAYMRRQRVAMIAFRERRAEVLFPPTNQVERVRSALDDLPLGGTTPLAAGLSLAYELLRTTRLRDPTLHPTLVLVSDGRANVGERPGYEHVLAEVDAAARALAGVVGLEVLFVDTTGDGQNDLRARELAEQLGAHRIGMAEIRRSGADLAASIEEAIHRWSAGEIPRHR